jgi:hypothetical protein
VSYDNRQTEEPGLSQTPHPRSVLYVAYPLLPVSDESAGGAEQMLSTLEHEMAGRGYRTAIAACAGSVAAGAVVTTGGAPAKLDSFEDRESEHNAAVVEHVWANERRYDLLHDQSGSFWRAAGVLQLPVLVTLHLPRTFYRPALFSDVALNVFFNCVSEPQAKTFADLPRMMGVVQNGIPVDRFPFTPEKRGYLLWMGRICEEKGTHIAIEVAARTGLPLIIAVRFIRFPITSAITNAPCDHTSERAVRRCGLWIRPRLHRSATFCGMHRPSWCPANVRRRLRWLPLKRWPAGRQ